MFTVTDKLGRINHYGADAHWYTDDMLAGTETVEEHLVSDHGLTEAEVATMDHEVCHSEHDRLHQLQQDDVVLAFMEAIGFWHNLTGG